MLRHSICTIFLTILFIAAELPAHAAVDLAARVPVSPDITVGRLPNGLTYYIRRNKMPEKKLELRLIVKAGSVLEDDDQQGLAHVVEHMAFNGSTHFRKHELVSYLQSIGVKFGADLNAYTSYDETVYILPVPTDHIGNIEKGFTVLADWAHGITFNDSDIDAERDIVLEELRLHKGAAQRTNTALMPKLFNGSKYGERPPFGKEETIRGFQSAELRRFYRDWYRPDLMAVIAVGDIDPLQAEQYIKEKFSALSNPAHERERIYPPILPKTDTEAVVVHDKEATTNSISIRYPVREVPNLGTFNSYRETMIEALFRDILNQRLVELTQQTAPPFIAASSGPSRITSHHQAYIAGATLGAGGARPALIALIQENLRARQYGFSAVELERARRNMLHHYEHVYSERYTTNSNVYVNECIRNFLAGETLPGIEVEYKLAQDLLSSIMLKEVNTYAQEIIPGDSAKLIIYIGGENSGSSISSSGELLSAVHYAEHATIRMRDEKILPAKIMDTPPNSGKIIEEFENKTLGLTHLTLSNGIKVILKPTDFHSNQVLLAAERFGGQMLFDEQDIANTRYASTLATVMGLKDFSPLDLQKVLAGKTASVELSLGSYTDNVYGRSGSSKDDIEAMLQILWLRFSGVRRDESLYISYMEKQAEILRNRRAQPEVRFSDVIIDTLYNKHPYEPRATNLDDVSKVSLDRSIAIYRQRFSSAKGLTFILVGNFEVAKIKPLLATYMATLPSGDIPVEYRDVGLRFTSGVVKKEVLAGVEPKSLVSITFTGPTTWTSTEGMRMAALVDIMNLKINSVLREKLGLIYTGGMTGSIFRIPDQHYSINAVLPTAPDKVDAAITAIFTEIQRIKTEGPSSTDLDKVKKNWRQTYQRSIRDNNYWLQSLQASVLDGTDPQHILNFIDEADALTDADIRLAARNFFSTNNYIQVVLKPER